MLKQRIATAILLAAAFLILVFWFPSPWFAFAMLLAVLAAALEWSSLVALHDGLRRGLWLFAVFAIIAIIWWYRATLTPVVIALGAGWWLLALSILWRSPLPVESVGFRTGSGILTLVPAWTALVYLHQTNHLLLLALFLLVWLADIGAYFCGRAWGKRKLAPAISPGKTIEGVVGGIVAAAVFSAAVALWIGADVLCGLLWLAVCMVTSLCSVVGDLWESKMKRIAGVKDSGSLLPGHGGVLDRVDSITAAAPVFVAGLYLASRGMESCGFMTVQG